MKFVMKRETLAQLNRPANKMAVGEAQTAPVSRVLVRPRYSVDGKAKEWISERAEML
jgi:hypothetical protein